ncbi:sarcosine oxidase subunit gamma [Defluviimonas sp. SAOS-178_SWC]|uniref:sarcosine oxidase subunit gamma n=1 Tax=Defluviimonas sp. SAOS-178_SWC TaxID=3121287 RepID=UPI0032221D6B
MADALSAVVDHLVPGRSGTPGMAGVRFSEIRGSTLIQFAAWPDSAVRAGAEAAKAVGAKLAPKPGRVTTGTDGTLLRVEPLKWWLISETAKAPSLSSEAGVALDLSQSRTRLHVSGRQAARLLNHVLPLDLSDTAFPEGSVSSTAFHHIGVTLWRDGTGFNLFLPRSFAVSLCEILIEIARQYGLEIA